MRINHNTSALNTFCQLSKNDKGVQTSFAKLSSGLRITKAADDSAGFAISQKMRSQIRGLNQASRNTQDGVSLIQTAEGALGEVHSVLQRMKTLAVQSASDTNTDVRDLIQQEVNQLAQEITGISNNTAFNGYKLLNGGLSDSGIGQMSLQVGANAGQNFSINIAAMDAKTLGVSGDGAPYGTNINVAFAGTPSYATDPGEAIKFSFTEGTPLVPPTTAQSAELILSKSYASDLGTALAASTSSTSLEKTDGGNISSMISGSPAFAGVDGETINLSYTQGSPAVLGTDGKTANLYSLKSYTSNLKTELADTTTTSIETTDGGNIATTVSGSPAFTALAGEALQFTYVQGSPEVPDANAERAIFSSQQSNTSNLKTALAAGSTEKTDGSNLVSSVTGSPSFASVNGEDIKFTYTAGIPEHLATTYSWPEYTMTKMTFDLKAALSVGSDAQLIINDFGHVYSISAASMRNCKSGIGVQNSKDMYQLLWPIGVNAWCDVDPGTNWGIQSGWAGGAASSVTLTVTGSSASDRAAIEAMMCMTGDTVTIRGTNTTPYAAAVDPKVTISDNNGHSQDIMVHDTDTSLTGTGYFAGLNVNLASGKTLADLTGNASSTVSFDITPASDAQIKITVDGGTPFVLTAAQMRSYNNGAGVQNGVGLAYCLNETGARNLWTNIYGFNSWGVFSDTVSSAAKITIDVTGSSAAERSAIKTLLGISSDSVTVNGQDATSGTPKVDSKVIISDNHGNSQAVVVNDTDTSFSGTGIFTGLNVGLTSGKSLADLTGNTSSTVSFDSVTTTTPSDAQLKITVDGGTPFVFTAAQLKSYNYGAGVQSGTDLYNFLSDNGVPNMWFDMIGYNGWGILSSTASSASNVSVEVTGGSAAQKSAIETLLGISSDSVTVYGQDGTIITPKVDSIVTIADNHGNTQNIVVNDGDTSLTGTGYFSGLNISLSSGKTLSNLNGDAASALSFASVTTTTPASDAQLKITVDGTPTIVSAADMKNYNSGAGVKTGDDLFHLLQSKGVNVTSGGGSDPNWKIQSPDQAASETVKVDITGSSASEKSAIQALLGISSNSVTVHGQDATSGTPAVSSKVTISDNHGHSEDALVYDGDSSFTGTGYFSALSVTLASGKTLQDLSGDAASTLVIPGGADTSNTARAAQFTDHFLTADATCPTGIDVTSQAAALSAITVINDAIGTVSTQRSKLGAYQNALGHTINNLSSESQNLTSALSQISDLDMAEEMTNFVRNKILMEAGQAMLLQANMRPQGVLSLLK